MLTERFGPSITIQVRGKTLKSRDQQFFVQGIECSVKWPAIKSGAIVIGFDRKWRSKFVRGFMATPTLFSLFVFFFASDEKSLLLYYVKCITWPNLVGTSLPSWLLHCQNDSWWKLASDWISTRRCMNISLFSSSPFSHYLYQRLELFPVQTCTIWISEFNFPMYHSLTRIWKFLKWTLVAYGIINKSIYTGRPSCLNFIVIVPTSNSRSFKSKNLNKISNFSYASQRKAYWKKKIKTNMCRFIFLSFMPTNIIPFLTLEW